MSEVSELEHATDPHVIAGHVQVAPSGLKVDYLNPHPDMIRVRDMAHHLARIHRFGAASDGTVAQHLVEGSYLCREPASARCFFLHDAEEYLMGDCPSPLKKLIGGRYREIADGIRAVIFTKFDLPTDWARRMPAEVKAVDDMLLEWERRDQMPTADWVTKLALPHLGPYSAWSTATAETSFLRRFEQLWPDYEIET